MEGSSLIDFDDVAGSPASKGGQNNVTVAPTATSGPKCDQQRQNDDPFDDFFSMSTETTAQPAPPTALVASPSSPKEQTAAITSSSAGYDPSAGFGSPATLPKEEQQDAEPQQSSKQQQASQKQQQVQQRLPEHHQHGRSEQLPFGHLDQHRDQQQATPTNQHHAADAQQQEQQDYLLQTPLHHKLQQHSASGTPGSISPSLLPVCERVATLGQILQQHGAIQGEANANIR